jgi:nitrite reductase/ring-hydroxylating ferredoxin subunit
MFKIIRAALLLSVIASLSSCQSDDDRLTNSNLVDISFQFIINTNLPQYSFLNFANNAVIVPNAGLKGFVVYSLSDTQYVAYELSDPNHSPNECSRMTLDGITLTCPCPTDENQYQIITGQPTRGEGRFGLKAYRANRTGNIITVTN